MRQKSVKNQWLTVTANFFEVFGEKVLAVYTHLTHSFPVLPNSTSWKHQETWVKTSKISIKFLTSKLYDATISEEAYRLLLAHLWILSILVKFTD